MRRKRLYQVWVEFKGKNNVDWKILWKKIRNESDYRPNNRARTKIEEIVQVIKKVEKMSLASSILFFCWVVIVVGAMLGWILMTISKQQNSIEDSIDDFDQGDLLWLTIPNTRKSLLGRGYWYAVPSES